MNFPPAPSANSGAGLKIGVIDTGVDCSHPDLASRCGTGFSFIADGSGPYQDDCCYEGQTRITDGHGTEVAGIIAASLNGTGTVAPAYSASIHPYRVCDRYANCTCLNAAMAVDSAVSAGMHLVNMSLTWPYPEYQLQCQILEDAIEVAYGVGVPVIVSTGNAEGTVLPSVYSTTIAVSGVHCTNYGFLLMSCGNRSDVRIQPGTSPASYYDLAAASEYVWAPRPVVHGGGSILFGGTSAATPIVTSAVAIAMQKWPDSRFQSQAIVQHLRNTAWQTVDHDPMRLGAGVLDATAFLAQSACAIYTCYPHFDP
jgi:subtilisin family serine protease